MQNYLLIALGGALGSVGRFWVANLFDRGIGGLFPWGTVIVNITGCFAIGFVASLTGPTERWWASHEFRTFFMVGACGGYTTFSSFSLQTLKLADDGKWTLAGLNVLGSVILCLASVWLGRALALAISQRQ